MHYALCIMNYALKKTFIFSLSSLDFFYLCISQFYNSVRQTFKKSLHDNGQWTRKNASV